MIKYRISTNTNKDKKIIVELVNDFDLLEILSLKLTQKEIYTSLCSDYGVVVGRVSVNNGLGIPNAKVSIFIPLSDEDENDPVISALYPYKSVLDSTEDGYRYNLLPSRKQHGGHEPTGTFPDQLDILTREEVLEVYEKYYKYTVKTNDSGDFMLWGVPVGSQDLHIDLDLSDIGCFSLRPYDFIRKGFGADDFKSNYQFKSDSDLDSLPQIKTFNQTIEVYPFWGNEDLCSIGITRSDFDLSGEGIKIEPKAYLIGGTFTDTGKLSVNKNCQVKRKMGTKCDLTTRSGKIEYVRFKSVHDEFNRPILEYGEVNENIEDDGSFLTPLPMNMDYMYTNEFGENMYTNDPNRGVPTSACYRLRLSLTDSGLERTRATASYLVPNIREFKNTSYVGHEDDKTKSYAFSLNFDDYPSTAVNELILNSEGGFYAPKDYFFRMSYNKVYTVSSFQNSYFHGTFFDKDNYLGIKELVPNDENDCSSEVLTPPVNFGIKNYTFSLFLADTLLLFEHLFNSVVIVFFNVIIGLLLGIARLFDRRPVRFLSRPFYNMAYRLQESTQTRMYLTTYPECDDCYDEDNTKDANPNDDENLMYCKVGEISITANSTSVSGSTNTISLDLRTNGPVVYTNNSTECSGLSTISQSELITNDNNYFLQYTYPSPDEDKSFSVDLGGGSYFYTDQNTGFFMFHDGTSQFKERPPYPYGNEYRVEIYYYEGVVVEGSQNDSQIIGFEEGCEIYDTPYNESIIEGYYTGEYPDRVYHPGSTNPPPDITSTNITNNSPNSTKFLPQKYRDHHYNRITPSGGSEFKNGVFYIIPGSQSNLRLLSILKEYKKRKRIGMLFCGGIVNYGFIDNWLSGSLYFFQFKAKLKEKKSGLKVKYCKDLMYYHEDAGRFYYRSTPYDPQLSGVASWGDRTISQVRLYHPTTIVDLGPRDEFVKEICIDPNLDPNCSVSRSIGSTSYQDFGEMLGLAINYRLDTGDNDFKLNNFFSNNGFDQFGLRRVFDGDILQLISINNEAGIEEFDLQNSKYSVYSPQFLDPEVNKPVFTGNDSNNYGPLPITLELSENGETIRACINTPDRLGDFSQEVPFYLWNKKGTGFGTSDDQAWDYSNIQVQPLQGMTYQYKFNNDDKYLLLPMTYNFNGQLFPLGNDENGNPYTIIAEFDIITEAGEPNNYSDYGDKYPGFTYLYATAFDSDDEPTEGTLYVRYGDVNTWDTVNWNNNMLVIKKTQDYYNGNKQILSTPFTFYFGLRPGKTGLDKLIEFFGPKGAFPTAD